MPANSTHNIFSGELISAADWIPECYRVLKDKSHFYTFCNINDIKDYLNIAVECGFRLHNIITMIKDTKMPNRWYLKFCESILFFRKGAAKPIKDMTSRDYEFVNMPTLKNGKRHITEKPLELIKKVPKSCPQNNCPSYSKSDQT